MNNHVIDHLTYCSYRANRGYAPDISPERWAKHYSNVPAMEAKYQAEIAIEKASAA